MFIYTYTDVYVNLCTCKYFVLRAVFNGFVIFLKEKCGIEYTNMKVILYIAISDLFFVSKHIIVFLKLLM